MSSKVRIFFDASLKKNNIGIGIYDFNDKEKYSSFLTYKTNSSTEAEGIAFKEAIKFSETKYPQAIDLHFFTDSISLYNKNKHIKKKNKNFFLHWLPREFNKSADELSKIDNFINKKIVKENTKQIKGSIQQNNKTKIFVKNNKKTPIEINLGKFLIEKYSLKQRLSLLNKIAISDSEIFFVKNMYNKEIILDSKLVDFYSIIYTLLDKHERPSSFKKIHLLDGFKSSVSSKIIERRIKNVFEY